MRRSGKALIIGGGIAGPAAAMALLRTGIEAVVYEATEEHRNAEDSGIFLDVAPNGLDALRILAAREDVLAAGARTSRIRLWSSRGKLLGEVANGAPGSADPGSVTLKRGRLHQMLRDKAIDRGARFEFGKTLGDFTTDADGRVTARFEDGSEAAGDLLIGADGVHSRVRHILDPGAPQPVYTGTLAFSGLARSPGIPAQTPGTLNLVFGKRALFGYHQRSSGEVYWFGHCECAEEPPAKSLPAGPSSTEWRRRLLALYDGDLDTATEIIGTTEDINLYPVHHVPVPAVWHRGSAVLIGDAAHPIARHARQGTSIAFEDALVLAKCLRDVPDTGQAFARYEQLRRERVERVVAFAERRGRMKPTANPVAIRVRDAVMPHMIKRLGAPEATAWLYGHRIDWDTPVA